MPVQGLNGDEFRALAGQLLAGGHRLRFQASGGSMQPFIQNNDILELAPMAGKRIIHGDLLFIETSDGKLLVHRVVKIKYHNDTYMYLIKGDSCTSPDGWQKSENILGRVEVIERGDQRIDLTSTDQQIKTWIWIRIAPWISYFSWLPEHVRHNARNWLLVS